jgi:hypothetical protein
MLKVRKGIEIYICVIPIDMRKAIDGLSIWIADELKCSPQSGHLFIFFNRSRDKIKILFWDRNGFVLHYKRLEKHRFVVPPPGSPFPLTITETQLHGLLAGLDFQLMGEFSELEYDQIF